MKTRPIPILQASIRVMNAVAEGRATGSISELARQLEISQASCFRIVKTLEASEWVVARLGGGYELSAGLSHMLEPLWPFEQLRDLASDPARRLSELTGLSVKLSVRQGMNAVTILRVESLGPISVGGRVGARFPLVVGSSGAVLSADLSEELLQTVIDRAPQDAWTCQTVDDFRRRVSTVRSKRVCFDRGSFHAHVHAASISIRDVTGQVRAAITVLGLPGQLDGNVKGIDRALRATSAECEASLAGLMRSGRAAG